MRKESADTQEYALYQDMEVYDDKSLEEMGFVPSAVSDLATRSAPKRASSFFDIAAILVEDDVKPHTIKLCGNCWNHRLTGSGETEVTEADCRPLTRFTIEKERAKHLLEEAAKAVQLETDSSRQNESPDKEEIELLRVIGDLRLDGTSMCKATKSGLGGHGEL